MRHAIGETLKLGRPLRALCCSTLIPAGETVEIMRRTSGNAGNPRTVIVAHRSPDQPGVQEGLHRVKLSAIWADGET